MIKQWKVKQRVTPCAWTLPYFIMSPSRPTSALFLTLLLFINSSSLVVLISKRKREGRDKGDRIDKEECHLLCALFCLSLFSIDLSSILFFAVLLKLDSLYLSSVLLSRSSSPVPL